ncbi:NACHT domain-containing protein [Streptomyces sp. NPDC055794]
MVAWTLCAVVAGGLLLVWALWSPDHVSAAASVLGTVAGLLGVLTVWAWRGQPRHESSDTGQIAETAQALARIVRRQWEDEAVLRQLFEPAPLPVIWVSCPRGELVDRRSQSGTGIVCHAHESDEVMETFREAAGQRLVLLGPAGSGKTTFAALLLLALLRTRSSDDPVPVLCPLASFDPSRENIRAWLQRRVTEDYPALGDAQQYGTSSVVDLITEHRLVPLLDGLDEVPPSRRTAVLAALNDTLPTNAPLVLTCRTDDYAHAVQEGAPLTHAAVLEPVPLRVHAVLAALRLSAPPERRHTWDALAERLTRNPHSPAAHVLTSPLMATLTRSVYASSDRDPVELTDSRRFRNASAIEHHLLDAFIPTLYARSRRQDPARGWDPDKAQHYLSFLAQGLGRQGTSDLAWWKLHTWSLALTNPWRRASTWLAVTLVGQAVTNPLLVLCFGATLQTVPLCMLQAVAVVPMILLSSRVTAPLTTAGRRASVSAVVALSGGLAATPATVPFMPGTSTVQKVLVATAFVGICLWLVLLTTGLPVPPDLPSHGRPSIAHWRRRLPRSAVSVACVAASFGLFFASYAAYVHREGQSRFLTSLSDGLIVGAILGVGLAFFRWVRAAPALDDQESVEGSLRADRLLAVLGGGACAVLFVLPDAGVRTSIWYTSTLTDLAIVAAFRFLDIGVVGLVLALATCAWPYYTLARFQFAIRGQLPWRLQSFLADAHHLGILRRVSSTYQFRHACLQHRLAGRARLPEPRPRADRTDSPSSASW